MKVICQCPFPATNKQGKGTDESKLNIDSRVLEQSENPRGAPEGQGGVCLEALLNISLKEMTKHQFRNVMVSQVPISGNWILSAFSLSNAFSLLAFPSCFLSAI